VTTAALLLVLDYKGGVVRLEWDGGVMKGRWRDRWAMKDDVAMGERWIDDENGRHTSFYRSPERGPEPGWRT
jgi:hypothetical protein